MGKRGALEQGGKESGLDSDKSDGITDKAERASGDVLQQRKIGVPRSRRRPGAAGPGVESLGNIFGAGASSSFGNTSTAPNSAFGGALPQQQSQTQPSNIFGTATTNGQNPALGGPFSGQSSANTNSNTLFTGTAASNVPGFTFGAAAPSSNPFSQHQQSQAQSNSNVFNTPPLSTPFKGFGALANSQGPYASQSASTPSNVFGAQPAQNQSTSPSDSMMVSPPQLSQSQGPAAAPPSSPTPQPKANSGAIFGTSDRASAPSPFASQPSGSSSLFAPKQTDSTNLFSPKPLGQSNLNTPSATGFPNPFSPSQSTVAGDKAAASERRPVQSGNPFAVMTPSETHSPAPESLKGTAGSFSAKPSQTNIFGSSTNQVGQQINQTPKPASNTSSVFLHQPSTSPPKATSNMFASEPAQGHTLDFQSNSLPGSGRNQPPHGSSPGNAHSAEAQDSSRRSTNDIARERAMSEAQEAAMSKHVQMRALNRNFLNITRRLTPTDDLSGLVRSYLSAFEKIESGGATGNTSKRRPSDALDSPPTKVPRSVVDTPRQSATVDASNANHSSSKNQSQTASIFQTIVDDHDATASPSSTQSSLLRPSATSQPTSGGLFTPQKTTSGAKDSLNGAPQTAPSKPMFGGSAFGTSQPTPASGQSANSASSVFKPTFTANQSSDSGTSRPLFGAPKSDEASSKPETSGARGFVPSFGASSSGTVDFSAQFGQKAKKYVNDEKAKRKAEDFDSDEDDEAEWEKKDAEKQREMAASLNQRASKMAKLIPGQGFSFESGSNTAENSSHEDSSASASISNANAAQPGTPNIFGHVKPQVAEDEEDSDEDNTESTPSDSNSRSKPGLSLFDRVEKPVLAKSDGMGQSSQRPIFGFGGDGAKDSPSGSLLKPATNSSTTSIFAKHAAPPESSASGVNTSPGDRTWKGDSESPIKFGASGNLVNGATSKASDGEENWSSATAAKTPSNDNGSSFGTTNRPFAGLSSGSKPSGSTPNLFGGFTSTTPSGSPAKSAEQPGSLFGAKLGVPSSSTPLFSTSRASTPGTGSVGTSANGSDDESAPVEAQSDLTGLSEEERKNEEVLFEVKAKLIQIKKGDAESPFKTIGTGPFRVLKNKETGAVRMLCRCVPRGQVVLNATLQAGMAFSKKQKSAIQFGAPDPSGVFQMWVARTGQDEKANELAKVLNENTPAS